MSDMGWNYKSLMIIWKMNSYHQQCQDMSNDSMTYLRCEGHTTQVFIALRSQYTSIMSLVACSKVS